MSYNTTVQAAAQRPWLIYRELFKDISWDDIYGSLKDLCKEYELPVGDKRYTAKRISCILKGDAKEVSVKSYSEYFSYHTMPTYDWSKCDMVHNIKLKLETIFKTNYDYCLCHIYRNGKDVIGWHNDKEALETDVVSVSFGASRRFLLRKIDQTSGKCDGDYVLNHGDVVRMLVGCQKTHKHSVPAQAAVKEPRINLTFRKIEM